MKTTPTALCVLVVALALLGGCNMPYSDGARVGTVFKFSNKGLFCKTWEGELATLGFAPKVTSTDSDGNTSVSGGGNTFAFTVKDPMVIPEIESAMDSGKRVKLTYHQVRWPSFCTTESGYFITKVEVLS